MSFSAEAGIPIPTWYPGKVAEDYKHAKHADFFPSIALTVSTVVTYAQPEQYSGKSCSGKNQTRSMARYSYCHFKNLH